MAANFRMPFFCTLGGRGKISPPSLAGVAKTHRHDGNFRLIIKLFAAESQPLAQSVAGEIVPWNAGFVDPGSRSLADNQKFRRRSSRGNHRFGGEGKLGGTCFAAPDFPEERVKFCHFRGLHAVTFSDAPGNPLREEDRQCGWVLKIILQLRSSALLISSYDPVFTNA